MICARFWQQIFQRLTLVPKMTIFAIKIKFVMSKHDLRLILATNDITPYVTIQITKLAVKI